MPTSISNTLTLINSTRTGGQWILLGISIYDKSNVRWTSFTNSDDANIYIIKNNIRIYINTQLGITLFGGQQCVVYMKFYNA